MTEYSQRANESDNSFMKRLCLGKMNGTIPLQWKEINELLGNKMSDDHLRKVAIGITIAEDAIDPDEAEERVIVERHRDGTITDERIIELDPQDLTQDKTLLSKHGYNPELWEVVSSRHSVWQAHTKGGSTKTLYASKITVKPRTQGFDPCGIIEAAMKMYTVPKYAPTNYSRSGKLLEVDVADLHLNELSWHGDTGESYDINIARKRVENAVSDIVGRIGDTKFERIILPNLGDGFHVDNDISATTKGTPQDTDTRYHKMFAQGFAMWVMVIEQFATLAPVEYLHIPGNHDKLTSFDMAFALRERYRNTPNITINADPISRKWMKYGVNLIGWMHGEMPKKHSSTWLSVEARKEYGETQFHEIHAGHYHDEIKPFPDGVTVRYLPTLKSIDKWHYEQGYVGARKTICSFVWDKDTGLSEIWYSNIKEAK